MAKPYKPTAEHKRAMAQGREEARAVKDYLENLEAPSPDPDKLDNRVQELADRIEAEGDPLKRVELIQRRLDVESELVQAQRTPDPEELERQFVASVSGYSERKGISYKAWREVGVPAAVLREAGVR